MGEWHGMSGFWDFGALCGRQAMQQKKTWSCFTKYQIDYVLIQQRWKSAIGNVGTVPSADCDSDNEMLKATFKIRLRTKKKF